MSFYTSIAPSYDQIFPFDPATAEWVAARLPPGGAFLDLGCATGQLALALGKKGFSGHGIDLDPEMVGRAISRAALTVGRGGTVRFSVQDMTSLCPPFVAEQFSLACCFGNTLVHLPDPAAITECAAEIFEILEPGGRFVGQIIGYDRILSGRLGGLPTIETPGLTFERVYRYDEDPPRLTFATRLTETTTGKVIDNAIPLYPLTKTELDQCLQRAGFAGITFWSDTGGAAWHPEAFAVWFEAVRPTNT
jgi:glycine/sarcosine N-methyltransferase